MKYTSICTLFVLLFPLLVSCTEKQVYIVYFGEHNGEKSHDEIEEHHRSYMFSLKASEEEAKSSLLYSYKHSINGFTAMLTPDEAKKLSELDEVVSVFPSKAATLHTTRSWEFLDVRKAEKRNATIKNDNLLSKAKYGKQIIVGLLDTGIWPESKSFDDYRMGDIPKTWKGICEHGDAFNSKHCNKKIIGARYYLKGFEAHYGKINYTYRSPRDTEGHGTHTSSTVGGRLVHAKIDGGFAHGTASGGAPLVHLAMYKVCWPGPEGQEDKSGCFTEDILAAMDDAIGDGVDVLSISVGGAAFDYAKDGIALGSLHAVKRNIVVTCSAGNSGPFPMSLSNTAPWIITVAASSVDRAFVASLQLGNGMKIQGESVTPHKLKKKMYPLVYAGDVELPNVTVNSGLCLNGTLSPRKAKGKIVFCLRGLSSRVSKGEEVRAVGGAGLILGNDQESGEGLFADAHVLPATAVGSISAQKILKYIDSTKNPTAYINPARTALGVKPAPFMAEFSSRGPNYIAEDLLKPDVTAPGLNILAAWTEASPTPLKYNMISGTSMSCPHVAAVAALIKAIHPTWSSAAIRSAIMTTAVPTNNAKLPITDSAGAKADPFQYGSGHLHPVNAADPGLVYDATYTDYLLFLCSIGDQLADKTFKCPKNLPSANHLNYPSLAISKLNDTVTVKRVLTNVGDSGATYIPQVEAPPGVSVRLFPSSLKFNHVGERKGFKIIVKAKKSNTTEIAEDNGFVFGSYSWSDGVHVVRSPIAVKLDQSA